MSGNYRWMEHVTPDPHFLLRRHVASSGGSPAAWQAVSPGRDRVSARRGRRSAAESDAPSQRDGRPLRLDRQRRMGQGGTSGARRQPGGRRRSTHHRAADHSAARVRRLFQTTASGNKPAQPVVPRVLGACSRMHLRRWQTHQATPQLNLPNL